MYQLGPTIYERMGGQPTANAIAEALLFKVVNESDKDLTIADRFESIIVRGGVDDHITAVAGVLGALWRLEGPVPSQSLEDLAVAHQAVPRVTMPQFDRFILHTAAAVIENAPSDPHDPELSIDAVQRIAMLVPGLKQIFVQDIE